MTSDAASSLMTAEGLIPSCPGNIQRILYKKKIVEDTSEGRIMNRIVKQALRRDYLEEHEQEERGNS